MCRSKKCCIWPVRRRLQLGGTQVGNADAETKNVARMGTPSGVDLHFEDPGAQTRPDSEGHHGDETNQTTTKDPAPRPTEQPLKVEK